MPITSRHGFFRFSFRRNPEPYSDYTALLLGVIVELGLGIARRLNQQQVKEGLGSVAADQVSFWYVANRLGKTSLRTAEKLLRDFQPIEQGIWQGDAVGHRMYARDLRSGPLLAGCPYHLVSALHSRTLLPALVARV